MMDAGGGHGVSEERKMPVFIMVADDDSATIFHQCCTRHSSEPNYTPEKFQRASARPSLHSTMRQYIHFRAATPFTLYA